MPRLPENLHRGLDVGHRVGVCESRLHRLVPCPAPPAILVGVRRMVATANHATVSEPLDTSSLATARLPQQLRRRLDARSSREWTTAA